MKVKIENQLFFAEVMKLKSEDILVEHAKWDGYCQGLKYCLGVLSESSMRAEHILKEEPKSMGIPSEILINGKKVPVILTSEHKTVDMKRFYELERGDGKECVCSPADLEPFGECQCK